ncbi:TetR/AcrR family transcriptional regulator [Isoptericola sp. S6320L]|uniref:TetR/AcrR family transcriptional regulator n=1 Tax=Isoptericola sp. S6320L TaxID=2926411 RepID=UPI001FF11E70|nr:TetR/AcrR family transcriptional regulator [Isoptericola sp. S6320L]MCK0115582.1 TetR/AcrR family transcriptional regulator [Isoptericola sp. S6320L]
MPRYEVADDAAAGLRERKKRATRRALVVAALESFTREEPDRVTVDDLCAQTDVSKRTFFRYFSSKEDVAMTPLKDMWRAFARRLAEEPMPGDADTPLLLSLSDVLAAAIREQERADGEWTRFTRASLLLDRTHSSFAAHNLQFCDHTVAEVLAILSPAPGATADEERLVLLLDMLVVASRSAQRAWLPRTGPTADADGLIDLVRERVSVLPDSLRLKTSSVRPGSARRAPVRRDAPP